MIDPKKTPARPARLRCRSCGETVECVAGPGDVVDIHFEHFSNCSFLKALHRGRENEWIRGHGNPMCVEAVKDFP